MKKTERPRVRKNGHALALLGKAKRSTRTLFFRTRSCSSQLTTFVIMIIMNDSVNGVFNFFPLSPRDMCEVSN